jgi:hypothetical protein
MRRPHGSPAARAVQIRWRSNYLRPSKEGPVMESWTAAAVPALVAGAIILYLFAAATL